MRIGCLQFAPVKGDVNNNLSRADAVLLKQNPEDLDLLVLPELAFTGYYFKSLNEIFPHLEPTGAGTSSLWARTVALKYDCTVVVGYPEKVDVTNKWPASPEYYNSAIVVDGDGQTTGGYRKSNLYSIDETWALEGQDGFYTGNIAGVENAMMGISMDITPYRFQTPWESFEFAHRVTQVRSNLVIVSLAWPTNQEGSLFSRTPQEPDMETLTHWVSRLEPVIHNEGDEEVIVVFANRTGTEDGVVYAGSSAVLGIKKGEVSVYGVLGRGDRQLLVVDTEKEPYGKLQYNRQPNTPLGSSLPFQDHVEVPPLRAAAPIPQPPPGPLLGPRGRFIPPSSTSGGPSISEVLAARSSVGTPASTTSPRFRGQPRLSLNTNPVQLEPPFPSVPTPSGPSPTPFEKRPRISIPPTESWTQRYIDSHMKSPVFHPMVISPPPVQILGGEVSILLSPLYSATDGSMRRPWDSPGFSEIASSPTNSDFTDFIGVSPTQSSNFSDFSDSSLPFRRLDAQAGSNASSRGEPAVKTTNVRVPLSPPPKVETNLERFSSKERQSAASPPQLLPMAYVPPTAQRVKPLTQGNLKRLRSPSSHKPNPRGRSLSTVKDSITRFRSESRGGTERGGTERGRSTGPQPPAIQPTNHTTTPANTNREQSRGRSRTHKHNNEEDAQTPRPSSRKKSRSNRPIDLSQFQVIEERPPANCAVHGTLTRSASQGQVSRKTSASSPTHNRSASAKPINLSQFQVTEEPSPENCGVHGTRSRSASQGQASQRTPPSPPTCNRSVSAKPVVLSPFQVIEEWRSETRAIHDIRSRSASQNQVLRRASTSSPTHTRSSSARRQRTVRHTPLMSNLNMSSVEKTPPPVRRVNTQLSTGVLNPSPIGASKPHSLTRREDQKKLVIQLSPTAVSVSPTGSNNTTPSPVAFHFPWGSERKSWVESWLPNLLVANQKEPSVSQKPSYGSSFTDPATPRAMVTAESRGSGNSPRYVRRLEVMVNAQDLTQGW